MSCSLGRGDGQVSHNTGIRLGAEHGMIECPECHQRVPVKPDGWAGKWWTLETHNQVERTPYVPEPPSPEAIAVINSIQQLSDSEQLEVMLAMGWTEYDESYG